MTKFRGFGALTQIPALGSMKLRPSRIGSMPVKYGDKMIVVLISGGIVSLVQVNLDGLMHDGQHGSLLKSQVEIDAAFQRLTELLDQVTVRMDQTQPDRWIPTKLEIGWHFPIPFQDLDGRLQSAKYPRMHLPPKCCRGHSVTFGGSERKLKFYNKTGLLRRCKQAGPDSPEITRIELVLSGKKLREVTGLTEPLQTLSFEDGRRWLREAIQQLEVPTMSVADIEHRANPRALICALADMQGWRPYGQSPLEIFVKGKSSKTRARLQKDTQSIVLSLSAWTSETLFPGGSWPAPVEILHNKAHREID